MPTPDAVLTRAARGVALVAGLTLLLVGLGLAVLLGPDGAWSATATVPAGRAAVLLEPSVVSVLGPRVAVTAEAADDAPLETAEITSQGSYQTVLIFEDRIRPSRLITGTP